MAVIRHNPIISSLAGSVGDVVFSKRKGSQSLLKTPCFQKTATASQLSHKKMMRRLALLWEKFRQLSEPAIALRAPEYASSPWAWWVANNSALEDDRHCANLWPAEPNALDVTLVTSKWLGASTFAVYWLPKSGASDWRVRIWERNLSAEIGEFPVYNLINGNIFFSAGSHTFSGRSPGIRLLVVYAFNRITLNYALPGYSVLPYSF
jgi:hypothetical protein